MRTNEELCCFRAALGLLIVTALSLRTSSALVRTRIRRGAAVEIPAAGLGALVLILRLGWELARAAGCNALPLRAGTLLSSY